MQHRFEACACDHIQPDARGLFAWFASVTTDVLVAKCELDMLLLLAHDSALLHNLCMHVTHIVATCARAACTADEEYRFYESLFRNSKLHPFTRS